MCNEHDYITAICWYTFLALTTTSYVKLVFVLQAGYKVTFFIYEPLAACLLHQLERNWRYWYLKVSARDCGYWEQWCSHGYGENTSFVEF